MSGHAAGLVTAELGVVGGGGGAAVVDEEVHWVSGSGLGWKRIRLNRKLPAHFVGSSVIQSRSRVWKRLHHVGHSVVSFADCKRRRHDQQDEGYVPVQIGTGGDNKEQRTKEQKNKESKNQRTKRPNDQTTKRQVLTLMMIHVPV